MRPRADTLLVWTGASCSYGCGSCPIARESVPAGVDPADLEHSLVAVPSRQGRLVVLLGGEPCLRPDFLRLIAVIRAAGCVPGIVTTGRPLVYPQWRERLRRAGIAYMRIQFFGCGEEHDRATQVPGAFEQAVAGARAWLADDGPACDVDLGLNFRQRPVAALVAEVERLAREIPSAAAQIVVAVDPQTGAQVDNAAALPRAVAALAQWNDDPTRPLLSWEGAPVPSATTPMLERAFVGATPRACCLGQVAELGSAVSIAAQETRANSFNYVRTEMALPWTPYPDMCTAHSTVPGADPLSLLWLVEDDRLVLHTTDTGDFTPVEIARVKDEWSHLFLDRAAVGMLDDFTEGMRRVLPEPTCNECVHRGHCGRRFRVVDGPPFAREEAWIASHMSALRGRVLDVGCGEQLYRNELAPLVQSGVIDYTGLDPDEPSIARIRAALPQGRFFLTGIEDFRDAPASYDHIVCLRSLNHVFDVDEALARMAELLRRGGDLLIVETTPFALLRLPEQIAAADQAPRAGHQHFRNVTSEDVIPYARRHSLRIVKHHPASLVTTNEWILLLERAGG